MDLVHNIHNDWTFALNYFDEDGNAVLTQTAIKPLGKIVVSNENFRKHFRRGK